MNRFIYLILLIFFISCNKKLEKESNTEVFKNSLKANGESSVDFFKFNDTVIINKNTLGEIRYNLKLDNLKPSDVDNRFVLLYVTTQDDEPLGLESIKKSKHKIFLDTIGNGTFYFEAKFTKTGNNLLNCVVEDVLFLKKLTKEGKVKMISNKTSISKAVFVVDK